MDELVKQVVEKTGIPEATARQVIETVIGFLKDKLPAPIASQIDGALGNMDLGAAADALKGLGGLFGRK